jgi:small membrane protein
MNLFQWVTLPLLGLLLLLELVRLLRGPVSWWAWLLRVATWTAAAVAIADPDLVQDVALALGIGRGADVVLYFFVLIVLGTAFAFYSRYVRLQRQLTQVVRHMAIQEARRGGTEGGGDGP